MFESIRYWNGLTLFKHESIEGMDYEICWRSGYITFGNAFLGGYDPQRIF